jgi:hypothetical protein
MKIIILIEGKNGTRVAAASDGHAYARYMGEVVYEPLEFVTGDDVQHRVSTWEGEVLYHAPEADRL